MRHVALISALLGLSFIQCSSSDKKGPKYPDASSFCVALAEAECSGEVLTTCLASSKEVCAAQRQTVCASTYVAPAQVDGLTYDAPQAESCVNAVSSAYGDAKISSAEAKSIMAACDAVFSKMGAKGDGCDSDSDCKRSDGLQCIIHVAAQSSSDAGETEGSCQSPTQVSGGNACSAPDAQCVAGYHCGVTSHCDQDGELASNCSAVEPCATGFQCSGGKCVEKLADGTDCTTADECLHGICLEGVNFSRCASQVTLAPSEPFCMDMHD